MLFLINVLLLILLWHLFLRLFFLYLKNLFLRINLLADCNVAHHVTLNMRPLKCMLLIMFLCKIFLLHDHISVLSRVNVAIVNVTLTPLSSHACVVKSLFRSLRVSILKPPTFFIINTALPPALISHISRAHRICKAPQYIHTALVSNPKNTSYLHPRIISGFHQSGTSLIYSALTLSSTLLSSIKPYFAVTFQLSHKISCNL